jgi:isochorismate synthase
MTDTGQEVRVRKLGTAFDLLAAYPGRDGFLFAHGTSGVVSTRVQGERSIDFDGSSGGLTAVARSLVEELRALGTARPTPVAVGALPFDPFAPGSLVIPARVVRRQREAVWLVDRVSAGRDPPAFSPTLVAAGSPGAPFSDIQLREIPHGTGYEAAVESAVARIHRSEISKVVLARSVEVSTGRLLDPRRLAHRLRAVDPSAYTFAAPVGSGACLVGASPELLVSRRGSLVRSNPLAGSATRSGDPEEDRANADELLESAKERLEHELVVKSLIETLGPLCEELTWDPEPVLLETANVWHLSTRVSGRLREPTPSSLELVAELHPTPAVAGFPLDPAMKAIAELEPFDRGAYAGPVGWMDASGDGEWALALRCAVIEDETARMFAGAGIVSGSDPAKELDETETKFRAFLDALRWG